MSAQGAVAGQVHGHDAVLVGEAGDLRLPHRARHAGAVQEEERGRVLGAGHVERRRDVERLGDSAGATAAAGNPSPLEAVVSMAPSPSSVPLPVGAACPPVYRAASPPFGSRVVGPDGARPDGRSSAAGSASKNARGRQPRSCARTTAGTWAMVALYR